MLLYRSKSKRVFDMFNYAFLALMSVICIFPLIHIFAISLSSNSAVAGGNVVLLPVDFTLDSYKYVLNKPEFLQAFMVTLKRIGLGVPLTMLITILCAYPLSRSNKQLAFRTFIVWLFVLTMLFRGGLIPTYLIMKETGLLNTIWALVISPQAVSVFNMVILLNFFRNLPKELEEAAFIDGAGHWTILWRIYLPLSLPALATITLFTTVQHWNDWFFGLIYMNSPAGYPLQSYLQTVVVQRDLMQSSNVSVQQLEMVSDRTSKAAQIFLGSLPILAVYPFLQRFFIKGIVLGSVKE